MKNGEYLTEESKIEMEDCNENPVIPELSSLSGSVRDNNEEVEEGMIPENLSS